MNFKKTKNNNNNYSLHINHKLSVNQYTYYIEKIYSIDDNLLQDIRSGVVLASFYFSVIKRRMLLTNILVVNKLQYPLGIRFDYRIF